MKIRTFVIALAIISILLGNSAVSSLSITTCLDGKNEEYLSNKCPVVLITGFGPFAQHDVNPSELIAEELNGQIIDNAIIIGLGVPVNLSNFTEFIEIVIQAIENYNPDFVFNTGLAASSNRIRIEKIGLNLKRESNEDDKFPLEKILPDSPWLHISPLPARQIVQELRKAGIPSRMSFYAGLSLCNGLLYSVLDYIESKDLDINAGFIHLPSHKSEEHPEGMELETMINATKIIVKTCLNIAPNSNRK